MPTSVAPAAAEAVDVILRDGGTLRLRPPTAADSDAVVTFFADLSHAWPAHPHTLRLMADTAGFSSAELLWLNPDDQSEPQDFALWAVK